MIRLRGEHFEALARIVGPAHLLRGAEELSCYSYDGTGRSHLPEAVILPQSTEEVAAILRLASAAGFPVVARGAGTGMTGGSLPIHGGLVLSLIRLNRILEIDAANLIAVVEPGVITGDLQREVEKQGLFYPPDPASRAFCTIGGNAAECAGGPRAVKYGVTRDYVIGMRAVLASGAIINTGVRTEKGVVGYDLTRLLVGSEGTLAIITSLTLRLLPLPQARSTFLLCCSSLRQGTELVVEILTLGITPCTLEFMDSTTVTLVAPRLDAPLPEHTRALLLVEIDGSEEDVARDSLRLSDFLARSKGVVVKKAQDQQQVRELWRARQAISPATFALKPHKISEDVVVPRSQIPDFVEFTERLGRELDLLILSFGHAGDGNIHVNIMVNKADRDEYLRGESAKARIFAKVMELKGSLSGEHGIGVTKSAFLGLEIDQPTMELMRDIKKLFDPLGILNPGKIFPEPKTPLA